MSKNLQYPIYVQWIDVIDWMLSTIEKYPRSARYSLGSRISDFSIEVLELIVEAIYTKERKELLVRINLLLEKLRVFFYLSQKRKYISIAQYQHVSSLINSTGQMVGGWMKNP